MGVAARSRAAGSHAEGETRLLGQQALDGQRAGQQTSRVEGEMRLLSQQALDGQRAEQQSSKEGWGGQRVCWAGMRHGREKWDVQRMSHRLEPTSS